MSRHSPPIPASSPKNTCPHTLFSLPKAHLSFKFFIFSRLFSKLFFSFLYFYLFIYFFFFSLLFFSFETTTKQDEISRSCFPSRVRSLRLLHWGQEDQTSCSPTQPLRSLRKYFFISLSRARRVLLSHHVHNFPHVWPCSITKHPKLWFWHVVRVVGGTDGKDGYKEWWNDYRRDG